MKINHWQAIQDNGQISADTVQVWSADLDDSSYKKYLDNLSDDEKARAARLKNSTAARRQAVSRGILRVILAQYLDVKPDALVFNRGLNGKPFLAFPKNAPLSFNASHSGQLLLIAIGAGGHIGVDVEQYDETIDFAKIVSLVFSEEEQRSLSGSKDFVPDFYALWTAKEAVLKASGSGFAYPSNRFCIDISAGKALLRAYQAELTMGLSCVLSSFIPAKGYSAALAVLQ